MRAVTVTAPGGPEVLALADYPRPRPAVGEVLIQVAAAGVNRADCLQRRGRYPPPPSASPLLGLEVAGTVVALGEEVTGWHVGSQVCALLDGGGYAQFCVAPAAQCLPVPEGISLTEAAAIPETFFTVWSNVFDRCDLQPGESFLVHGGASGIGTTAIQLARAFGARVFATVGNTNKTEICQELGAQRVIHHPTEDFVEVVHAMTEGTGVDVILDMVGGDYVQRNLSALAIEGRVAQIAFLRGAKVHLNLAPILIKRLTVTGSALRARPVQDKLRIAQALHGRVWPLLEAGTVRPVIFKSFPLKDAHEAHRLMESNQHLGKLVLVPEAAEATRP